MKCITPVRVETVALARRVRRRLRTAFPLCSHILNDDLDPSFRLDVAQPHGVGNDAVGAVVAVALPATPGDGDLPLRTAVVVREVAQSTRVAVRARLWILGATFDFRGDEHPACHGVQEAVDPAAAGDEGASRNYVVLRERVAGHG